MVQDDERTVKIMAWGTDFHLVSRNHSGPEATITQAEWNDYITKRTDYLNVRQQLEIKLRPPRDKKMYVQKYHPD